MCKIHFIISTMCRFFELLISPVIAVFLFYNQSTFSLLVNREMRTSI